MDIPMKKRFLEKYICLTWVLQNVMYNIQNNNSEHSFSIQKVMLRVNPALIHMHYSYEFIIP